MQFAKVQQQNEWKKKSRVSELPSMDPEYVTGQINSYILEPLLRLFILLIFAPSRKSSYAIS